jgi:hypothetical protein
MIIYKLLHTNDSGNSVLYGYVSSFKLANEWLLKRGILSRDGDDYGTVFSGYKWEKIVIKMDDIKDDTI